jgi:hypothetical protein
VQAVDAQRRAHAACRRHHRSTRRPLADTKVICAQSSSPGGSKNAFSVFLSRPSAPRRGDLNRDRPRLLDSGSHACS